MTYRLLACDIDNTIVRFPDPPSRRVKDTLTAAREAGVTVALATGRAFRRARPVAQMLDIDAPIICDDATAQMVARYALQARCRPQMLTTLQVQRDDRLRPGALVRVIESALSLDVVAEVSAVRYTGDESLTITVRHWAQQGKEPNYA